MQPELFRKDVGFRVEIGTTCQFFCGWSSTGARLCNNVIAKTTQLVRYNTRSCAYSQTIQLIPAIFSLLRSRAGLAK